MLINPKQLLREIIEIRTELEFPADLEDTAWFNRATKALVVKRVQWYEYHRDNNLPYVYV